MFFANSLGPAPAQVTPNMLAKLIRAKMNGRPSVSSEELFAMLGEIVRDERLGIPPEAAVEILASGGKLKVEASTDTAQVAA